MFRGDRKQREEKNLAPKGPAPIRLYEIALHARPPAPAAKSSKIEKFEFWASNGLVWGQTICQSTQLNELRRSRKVSAPEDTIPKSYDHLKSTAIFNWFSLFAKHARFWPGRGRKPHSGRPSPRRHSSINIFCKKVTGKITGGKGAAEVAIWDPLAPG